MWSRSTNKLTPLTHAYTTRAKPPFNDRCIARVHGSRNVLWDGSKVPTALYPNSHRNKARFNNEIKPTRIFLQRGYITAQDTSHCSFQNETTAVRNSYTDPLSPVGPILWKYVCTILYIDVYNILEGLIYFVGKREMLAQHHSENWSTKWSTAVDILGGSMDDGLTRWTNTHQEYIVTTSFPLPRTMRTLSSPSDRTSRYSMSEEWTVKEKLGIFKSFDSATNKDFSPSQSVVIT